MLHLSTETYNNEQVSKVFKAKFHLKHALKWITLVVNPPKSPSAGAPPPDPLASGGWGLHPQIPV